MSVTAPWNQRDSRRLVAFRADASLSIGTGHIMRCLTLADELRRNGVESLFICRSLPGEMSGEIERRGHRTVMLTNRNEKDNSGDTDRIEQWLGTSAAADAEETIQALRREEVEPEWMIVDHYGIDQRWERRVKPRVGCMLVIDDLADRSHDCDLLLDQNLYERMSERYEHLVNPDCVRLLGPHYALIREEFLQARTFMEPRSGSVHRLFVFFGGVDSANLTSRTLTASQKLKDLNLEIDVVIGNQNPHRAEIEALVSHLPHTRLQVQSNEMARLMAQADLSIGAGGTTTWERAYLGLPSVTVVVAENQREMTDTASRAGACVNLGWHEQVTVDQIAQAIRSLCESPRMIRKMSGQALAISAPEHLTGTSLVAKAMLQRVRVLA